MVQFELFSLGNGYRHWRMQVVIFGPRLKFCAARYVWIRTQIIPEESGNSRNCYSSIQSYFITEDAFPTFEHVNES